MKKLSDCKEFYEDLYMDCLEENAFEKNIYESAEKAMYRTLAETLKIIYGEQFERIEPTWQQEALNEFYTAKFNEKER